MGDNHIFVALGEDDGERKRGGNNEGRELSVEGWAGGGGGEESVFPAHSVTAVARKRSWSFCQKCRWQVPAKHACT